MAGKGDFLTRVYGWGYWAVESGKKYYGFPYLHRMEDAVSENFLVIVDRMAESEHKLHNRDVYFTKEIFQQSK